MSHGSKAEVGIWNEFHGDWENLAYTSETILAGYKNTTVEESAAIPTDDLPREGKERESVVKTRVNQSFFRKTILASYEYRCCITGITIPDLLVASHIVPWAEDAKNRLNPHNGLCLNALHDKAFDRFLITITEDFRVKIADILKTDSPVNRAFFIPYDNLQITLPQRFRPAGEFLRRHFGEFTGTKEVNSKQ
jgi:putative restriction endonuclease